MSQFKAKGKHPTTKEDVEIIFGYDSNGVFKPGYFFQVYLLPTSKDFKEDSENCILNKGFLNGISAQELKSLKKGWSCKKETPKFKKFWI